MRLRKVAEAVEAISSLPARSASRPGLGFRTHDSLHMIPKYESAIFNTHRQIRWLVYTRSSGSNLRSEVKSHRGGFAWQFRRISLNWNGNIRFSKTNCTKLSCTFQRTI